MKLKSFVAVAISSVLATSFAYAAPAAAPADDSGLMQAAPTTQENIGSLNNSPTTNPADMGVPGPASSNTPDAQMPMDNTMGGSEEMSADTATGDDDY